jgi:hypothetical protein
MKFCLLAAACMMPILNSCKKPDNNPVKSNNNTITATVDGQNLTFNTGAGARIVTNETGIYPDLLEITGATDASGNNAIIVIDVTSINSITTGTFPSADTNPEPATTSGIIYNQNVAGSQLGQQYITNNNLTNSTSVTVTSLSSTNVQGTFNGALVYFISGGGPGKTITNGKFNLAIN